MKKVLFASALVMSMGMGSAIAAGGPQAGKFGLTMSVNESDLSAADATGMITGRYMISSDLAVNAGFGLQVNGGDAPSKGTDLGLMAGVRKYMRTTDFSPFVGGVFAYQTYNDSNTTDLALAVEFGGEYFFSNNFSVEGAGYFGYGSNDNKGGLQTTSFGTQGTSVGVNYYF